jgi:NADH dehydrogenase
VDDLAELTIERGRAADNGVTNALGPEDFTYRELVTMIRDHLGLRRPVIGIPPDLAYWAGRAVGALVGDVFVTREEVQGLMADTLHVAGATPTGTTCLSDWVRLHKETIGARYHGELPRRKDRTKAY